MLQLYTVAMLAPGSTFSGILAKYVSFPNSGLLSFSLMTLTVTMVTPLIGELFTVSVATTYAANGNRVCKNTIHMANH